MFLPLVKPILRLSGIILSVILFAVTILAAYGGHINPDIMAFPSTFTLVFPYFAWATVIVTVIWFCFGKIFIGGAGVLTLLICWGPFSTVSPFGASKKPEDPAQTFRLMTYNMIHGWDLEDMNKPENRTIQYILDSDCDIVCVQELVDISGDEIPTFSQEQRDKLKQKYPYVLGSNKIDNKLLSKYPGRLLKTEDFVEGPFDPGRFSIYELNVKGNKLTVVNMHMQSYMLTAKERDVLTDIHSINDFKTSYRELKGNIRRKMTQGFKKRKKDSKVLREVLNKIRGPLIVCGDFNDVPESYAYRILRGDDLRDAYVETNFGPMITYNQHLMYFHIDQILYRGDLKALSVRKGKIKASDHYPLIAEFEFLN